MLLKRKLWITGLFLCVAVLAWTSVGCSRGPKLPPLVKLTGNVTLDGKPVTTGMVTLVPDITKGTDGPMAIGAIDSNGHYTARTVNTEGVIPGFYKVRVENFLGQAWAVPAKYADTATSGLVVEVKANEENKSDLKLTTKR